MRLLIMLLACASCGVAAAQQTAADPAPVADSTAEQTTAAAGPGELTRQAAEEVLSNIKKNRALYESDDAALYKMVDEVILTNFDFRTMSLLVLGPHWKKASEEQRDRFVAGFKDLLIRTYAKALLQYGDETIDWMPVELAPGDTRTLVQAKVQTKSGPITMNWRLRQVEEQWRVYDVIVDGISLVTNYRGSYNAEIRKVGLDGLLDKLEASANS